MLPRSRPTLVELLQAVVGQEGFDQQAAGQSLAGLGQLQFIKPAGACELRQRCIHLLLKDLPHGSCQYAIVIKLHTIAELATSWRTPIVRGYYEFEKLVSTRFSPRKLGHWEWSWNAFAR
jgi:hypothetical protein